MTREKITKEKLGLFLAEEAKNAREAVAEACFAKDAVAQACTEAAKGGYPGCVIKLSNGPQSCPPIGVQC